MSSLRPGQEVVVTVGAIAHGGHCVARHDGQVLFVRHALPGEQVLARVTDVGKGGAFLRADAIDVRVASPDRVQAPCPHARPDGCGGCDFQHATLPAQRKLKTAVLVEALSRLGGLTEVDGRPLAAAVEVVAVPGDEAGLRWRTRVTFAAGPDGRLGLRRHRSHDVEPVEDCRIAHPGVASAGVTGRRWPGFDTVEVVASGTGETLVLLDPPLPTGDARAGRRAVADLPADVALAGVRGRRWVTEVAADRTWRVDGAGFWQCIRAPPTCWSAPCASCWRPRPGSTCSTCTAGSGSSPARWPLTWDRPGGSTPSSASLRAVRDARR